MSTPNDAPRALGFATLYLFIEETKRLRALAKTYRQLFGSQAAIDTWIRVAPTTAGQIQQSFHETMILALGRMLDPASTGAKGNLSLAAFINDIPIGAAAFEERLMELQYELTVMRQWRHKYYAHRDANTAYSFFNAQDGEKPLLETLQGEDIASAAEKICDFVAKIEKALGMSSVLQDRDIAGPDGELLMNILEQTLR